MNAKGNTDWRAPRSIDWRKAALPMSLVVVVALAAALGYMLFKPGPPPPPAPAGECILSPCSMAAEGLSSLIGAGGRRPTFLSPQAHDAPSLPDPATFRRIVVFLPDDPFWLLFTLRQAALLLDRSASALPIPDSERPKPTPVARIAVG